MGLLSKSASAFQEELTLPCRLTVLTFLLTNSCLTVQSFPYSCLCKDFGELLGASDSQRAHNIAESKRLDGARRHSVLFRVCCQLFYLFGGIWTKPQLISL